MKIWIDLPVIFGFVKYINKQSASNVCSYILIDKYYYSLHKDKQNIHRIQIWNFKLEWELGQYMHLNETGKYYYFAFYKKEKNQIISMCTYVFRVCFKFGSPRKQTINFECVCFFVIVNFVSFRVLRFTVHTESE